MGWQDKEGVTDKRRVSYAAEKLKKKLVTYDEPRKKWTLTAAGQVAATEVRQRRHVSSNIAAMVARSGARDDD
ncbi:MAG: hypothetical protein E5W86_28085 [Mesorhizobium sp.]|nr:MAG: hypothetical protein E5W86_28085 [Mesorhizobium sp.]